MKIEKDEMSSTICIFKSHSTDDKKVYCTGTFEMFIISEVSQIVYILYISHSSLYYGNSHHVKL